VSCHILDPPCFLSNHGSPSGTTACAIYVSVRELLFSLKTSVLFFLPAPSTTTYSLSLSLSRKIHFLQQQNCSISKRNSSKLSAIICYWSLFLIKQSGTNSEHSIHHNSSELYQQGSRENKRKQLNKKAMLQSLPFTKTCQFNSQQTTTLQALKLRTNQNTMQSFLNSFFRERCVLAPTATDNARKNRRSRRGAGPRLGTWHSAHFLRNVLEHYVCSFRGAHSDRGIHKRFRRLRNPKSSVFFFLGIVLVAKVVIVSSKMSKKWRSSLGKFSQIWL
jgi:hypothetical protein